MTDRDLIAALADLGATLEQPPDLVADVRRRVDLLQPHAVAPWPRRRRAVIVALAVLLLVTATAVASSQSVRDWLLRRGVDAQLVESLPKTTAARLVDLGQPVDNASASRALGRAVPESELLGRPDSIRLARSGRSVTLVWRASSDLPAPASFPGVGALLTLVPAPEGRGASTLGKLLAGQTEVEFLTFADGRTALWIGGAPHAVRALDGSTVRFRLSANVVIWTAGETTFRLETTRDRRRAVALAESFTR